MGTILGDMATTVECSREWRKPSGVPGLAPPHLLFGCIREHVLCTITIPVQLLWYFGLLYCVSKSMFGLSCFCTVWRYFSLESSVNRSTMSLL